MSPIALPGFLAKRRPKADAMPAVHTRTDRHKIKQARYSPTSHSG